MRTSSIAGALAGVVIMSSAAAAQEPAGADSAEATSRSPFSLVSGASFGAGWAFFDYAQNAPDSVATYEGSGFEYMLALSVNIYQNRLFITAGYGAIQASSETEEVRHSLGLGTNSLEPDFRKLGLGLAAETPGPLAGRYRGELGYRWIHCDFLRRDFRLDGTPVPGAPDYTSENYSLSGLSLGGSVLVPLGSAAIAGYPLRARAEGEAIFIENASIESPGLLFETSGFGWDGRLGIEAGTSSWSLGLFWRNSGTDLDGTGLVTSPAGPVRRGDEEIRLNTIALLFRLGS